MSIKLVTAFMEGEPGTGDGKVTFVQRSRYSFVNVDILKVLNTAYLTFTTKLAETA
jgi:hypothetical protein